MEDVKYGIYPLTAFIAQPQQSKTRAPTPESCKSDKSSSLEPQVQSSHVRWFVFSGVYIFPLIYFPYFEKKIPEFRVLFAELGFLGENK